MSKLTNEQLDELIQELQGTCGDLNSSIQEILGEEYSEDDLEDSDHNYISNSIFLCTDCGWWCESHEESEECLDGERICNDCEEIR